MVRHQGGRQASYRGQAKVLSQMLLTALAVNVKRMVKLLTPKQELESGLALRAAVAPT